MKKYLIGLFFIFNNISIGYAQCWETVANSTSNTFAIKTDGTLWATGFNQNGQLGDGTTINRNYMAQVGNDNDWKYITTNGKASLAIKNNSTLWFWGGSPTPKVGLHPKIPTQVGNDTDWKQVECGYSHCLALKNNGTLWVWGSNTSGQLGNPNLHGDSIMQMNADSDWKLIANLNANCSAAIKNNGTLWAWGVNQYGQLGDSTLGQEVYIPAKIGTDNDWEEIGISWHTVAKKNNGSFWVWGRNDSGQLGNGNNNNLKYPMQINQEYDWKSMKVGYNQTFAIKTDNTLWSWGSNIKGQLGLGNNINYNSPQQVGNDNDWVRIISAGGSANGGAIKSDNTAWICGFNESGQLGDGTYIDKNTLQILSCNPLSVSDAVFAQTPITLTPNPVKDVLYLHNMPANGHSRIYNMLGALVYDAIGNTIDVSFLPAGLYNLYTGYENIRFVKE